MNARAQIPQAGIVHGLSNSDYHALPSVSSSMLKTILRSPAHYAHAYLSGLPQKAPTPQMVLGTLTHTAYLEPNRYEDDYIVAPQVDRRTKEGKAVYAEFEALANGRTVVTEDQAALAEAMAASLCRHDVDMLIRDGGHVEASIFYTDTETGHACRIRPDWHMPPCADWPTGVIVDLKTTDDARPEAFSRTCVSFGYDLSAAMYCDGFMKEYSTDAPPLFLLLVVERDAPHGVMAYEISDEMLAIGQRKYRQAMTILNECAKNESWPCYPAEIQKLDLPKWAQ